MIEIHKYTNALIIKGHAHSNTYGKDIICAGVSAISMGALNWFDTKKTQIICNAGLIEIIIDKNYKNGFKYLKLMFYQLFAIQKKYNEFIKIILHPYYINKE